MKIKTLIIILVFLGLGYFLFNSEPNELDLVLKDLEEASGVDFPEPVFAQMKWNVKNYDEIEEKTLSGQGFNAVGITMEQADAVQMFFVDNDFQEDDYNGASGTVAESIGYKKGNIVCAMILGFTGHKEAEGQWEIPDPEKFDVDIACAGGGELLEHLYSKEELIQQLFADKYGMKLSQISLTFFQETEDHILGGVEFQPIEPGSAGAFLVAKQDGKWILVFDGNGSVPCVDIEPYDFPIDMVPECIDDQGAVQYR